MEPEANPLLPEAERRLLMKRMRRVSRANDLHCVIDRSTGALRDRPNSVPILCSVLKNSAEYSWRSRTVALRLLRHLPIPPENVAEVAKVTGQILNGADTNTPQRWITRGLFMAGRWCLCLLPYLLAFIVGCLLRPGATETWLFWWFIMLVVAQVALFAKASHRLYICVL